MNDEKRSKPSLVPVLPGWSALHSIHYQFLANQQNMLEDLERTGAYHRGMTLNRADFEGRTVLDVGTGTGILSLFAAQAGARKVYAVEGTESSDFARRLVQHNGLADRVQIVRSTLLDLELPEKVDIIISEPWGFFMFHERMVEAFLIARDRHLAPGGTVMPSTGRIWMAPFVDRALYDARVKAVQFWEEKDFFGVDFSGLSEVAREKLFEMPAVGYFPPHMLMASPAILDFDFRTMEVDALARIELPFEFVATHPGPIHGIAGWFDVAWDGSQERVRLSTSPDAPRTHWMQLRFVFKEPVPVRIGSVLAGSLVLVANEQSSYTAHLQATLDGQPAVTQRFELQAHFWWGSGE
ncbi:MAG TPA: class I SAM-dependent methyltransferase [Polyangiaceae bacterium]